MSKLDKFKAIFDAVEPLAKPLVPGAAGTVLDAMTQVLGSHASPASGASADGLKHLADEYDAMTQALLALAAQVRAQGERIAQLEAK